MDRAMDNAMDHAMDHASAARMWLLHRTERHAVDALGRLVQSLAEELSLATADAATMRVLSEDGAWLHPVAAYHPDPVVQAALSAVMDQTVQRTDVGLWQTVLDTRRPARFATPGGYIPPEASAAQVEFLRQYPIRAVLAVPLLVADHLVGGVALVRLVTDRPFDDDDERLLLAFAEPTALVLRALRELTGLRDRATASASPP